MKDFIKSAAVLSFVGGGVAIVAGDKFIKSDKARTIAVNSLASGMKFKEDAKDICYEAKAKNEKD